MCPHYSLYRSRPRLDASSFIAGDRHQLATLGRMGIKIMTMDDGRVQLLHTAAEVSDESDKDRI